MENTVVLSVDVERLISFKFICPENCFKVAVVFGMNCGKVRLNIADRAFSVSAVLIVVVVIIEQNMVSVFVGIAAGENKAVIC